MNKKLCIAGALALIIGHSGLAAETTPIPEKMVNTGSYQGTPWLSGGVGKQEREYLIAEHADDYNLKLEFAAASGAYLGDVEVTIAKPDGEVVVQAVSTGPWFMTALPAGTYQVRATAYGATYDMSAEVPETGLKTVVFNQWPAAEVAEEIPGPGL
jgi:hypothetical protein